MVNDEVLNEIKVFPSQVNLKDEDTNIEFDSVLFDEIRHFLITINLHLEYRNMSKLRSLADWRKYYIRHW